MKTAVLCLSLSLAVLLPGNCASASPAGTALAQSQTMEEEKNFFLQVMQLVFEGKDESARSLVVEKRELARQTFAFFLRTYARLPDEQQKQVTARFLNLVAATFEDQIGEKQLTATLKKHKLWVAPGKKTASAPQFTQASAELEGASKLAARFGHFLAQQRLCEASLRLREKDRAPSLLEERILQGAYLAWAGQPNLALSKLSPLLTKLNPKTDPELEFRLLAALLEAGGGAARPDVVATYQPRLLQAAQRVRTYKGNLFRYVANTWNDGGDGQLSSPDFLARCQAVLRELRGYAPEGDTLGDGRLFARASRYWIQGLTRRARDAAPDPALQKSLLDQLGKIQDQAAALDEASRGSAGTPELDYNPEFSLAALEIRQLLMHNQLEAGQLAPLRANLMRLDGELAQWEKQLKALELLHEKTAVRAAERCQGGDIEADILHFSLLEGDFARLMVLHHRLWERLLQAEPPQDPALSEAELERHLGLAEQYQEQQIRGQGHRGMGEETWERLDWLLRRQPNQWALSAENLASRALQLSQDWQDQPGVITALTYQGQLAAAQGKDNDACLLFQRAVEAVEASSPPPGPPPGVLLWERAYQGLARAHCLQGRAEQALVTCDRLQRMRALVEVGETLLTPPLANLRRRLASLHHEMRLRRASKLDVYPLEVPLAEAKAELLTLHNQLAPRHQRLLSVQPPNLPKLQQLLPKNVAVVQYLATEEALFILVVSDRDIKLHRIEITREELASIAQKYSQLLLNIRPTKLGPVYWIDDGSPTYKDVVLPYKDAATSLHRLLLDPIEFDIADKDILAFLPGDALAGLPLGALARQSPHKGLEFLVERKLCVNLYTLSDLELLGRKAASGEGGVLSMVDPASAPPFSLGEGRLGSEIEAIFPVLATSANASVKIVGSQVAPERLNPLPPGTSYLHLALPARPDGLTLSGGRLLSLADIHLLKLDGLRLVTLSESRNPARFSEAFQAAGAGATLGNLWRAPDTATQQLLVAFYKKVREGQNLAQALQSAQLSLLAQPQTAHPYFWAQFALYGDWR